MAIKIKICGLTTFDAVRSTAKAGADYAGFVFYPLSPRYVSPQKADSLSRHLLPSMKKVAVLVDASDNEIDTIIKVLKPDYLQCHGSETLERIGNIKSKYKTPVIKAISVRSSDDVSKGNAFAKVADMLLFDAKVPSSNIPGGNGLAFDWSLLKEREFDVPWFLSGGLNTQNVNKALSVTGAKMVDVSSSLESEPGVKDPDLVRLFIEKVKQYEK